MEARIARLESDVGHVRADISELNAKVDGVREELGAKIGRLQEKIDSAMIWALLLYVALAAGVYATMARGFGWL